ncbi:hypothetical protein B0E54_02861 [Micromonospora sp. MH99]|nr:hypothetical protein [Micromonospora sp. MH99]
MITVSMAPTQRMRISPPLAYAPVRTNDVETEQQ